MIIDLIFALLTVGLLIGILYFKTSRRRPHGSPSATPGLQNIVSADIEQNASRDGLFKLWEGAFYYLQYYYTEK